MCGIAAIISADRNGRDEAMRRMLPALRHRGPDGEGTFHDEHASLGHRRLSIIDLEGGKQPLRNAASNIWLVCNGEIYNHRELRRELERDGHQFLTNSDCEVIIALYEHHGDRLLEHLRGMFAFALWDAPRRRLLAARDHLGQKPLFYQLDATGFSCASEIKALRAADQHSPRMNLAALDQYLALRLIDAPLSMFEGICKLPPGHLLTLQAGEMPQVRAYWDLPQLETAAAADEAQLLDELEAQIEAALRQHLVSDVPVGAFLSGGLDSSLLVAMLARKLHVRQLPTFTMGLNYQRYDEAPAARAVAEWCGTEHHEERVEPQITALLPDLIAALDEPSDPLSLCTWLLARFTRRHVKVVIGGDGGDELFGGYDRYYGNLYAAHYGKVSPALRNVLAPAFALIPESGWYKSVGHQLRWLHRLSFHYGSARYAAGLTYFYFDRERRQSLFAAGLRHRWMHLDAEAAIRRPYETAHGGPLERMMYADSKVRLPNHPVMITDRICMAHGLEARSPFMDHKLAEFATRLPPSMKVRGRTLRYIQRRLASRYLPAHIVNRPKQGFSSALPYLLQAEYARLYASCLADSRLVRDGILNGTAIAGLVAEHTTQRADHGNRLWLLVNAELWYRMAILGQSKEELGRELGAADTGPRQNNYQNSCQGSYSGSAV